MNRRVRINRLLKLADYLDERVAIKDFNMRLWYLENDSECGYAACALGHAANIPSFRRAGLRLREIDCYSSSKAPSFQGFVGIAAAMGFFGLGLVDAENLFYPSKYPLCRIRPHHVAKRIRQLVGRLVAAQKTNKRS